MMEELLSASATVSGKAKVGAGEDVIALRAENIRLATRIQQLETIQRERDRIKPATIVVPASVMALPSE